MGRWSQYDDVRDYISIPWTNTYLVTSQDLYRLPEGMQRVAYDADTQVYTFRDDNGKLYQGSPRARYGRLTPINTGTNASGSGKCFFVLGLILEYQVSTLTFFQGVHI
jgi:hypothetical protein